MTYSDLITEVRKYMYLEDTGVIKMCLASIIATRMRLGEPVWGVVIGPSSGGKSQILRPMSMTDPKFLHRVDDLTENTFLSGMKVGKGKPEPSLLHRIGNFGMIVISDLTVLFSKGKEARTPILGQFRMIYDGEMTKYSGTSGEPLHWGPGSLGVLAGATPSIYSGFEEAADMGERFIYYRMKDYDMEKAARLAISRKMYGRELDTKMGELFGAYIKESVKGWGDKPINLPEEVNDRLIKMSVFAERIRTAISMDFQKKEIVRMPVPAGPARVALQLESLAKAFYVMGNGVISEEDMRVLDWCAYSLANEEKRGVLKLLALSSHDNWVSAQKLGDLLGLSTNVTRNILQNLSAINIVQRSGDDSKLVWRIKNLHEWHIIRRVEGIEVEVDHGTRDITEDEDSEALANEALESWDKK